MLNIFLDILTVILIFICLVFANFFIDLQIKDDSGDWTHQMTLTALYSLLAFFAAVFIASL